MATYAFKRDTKVYIVWNSLQYRIDVKDINFSQTFADISIYKKTLHNQHLTQEGSIINSANPANFEFSLPIIRESDHNILFSLLTTRDTTLDPALQLKTFDLYIDIDSVLFKIENCIVTNGSFSFNKGSIFGGTFSGQGSRLTKYDTSPPFTIPGTPQTYTTNPTYSINTNFYFNSQSYDIPSSVFSASVEVQNEVNWTPYKTLNASYGNILDGTNCMIPTKHTVNKRILSGSFSLYLDTESPAIDYVQDFVYAEALTAEIGQDVGGTVYGLSINCSEATISNRLGVSDTYIHSYDWRLTSNPSDLSDAISLITI